MNIVVSGGFDPIHSGHIEYLKKCKRVWRQINSCTQYDSWLEKRKATFMTFNEKSILEAINT